MIRRANDTRYGLSTTVWTQNLVRALTVWRSALKWAWYGSIAGGCATCALPFGGSSGLSGIGARVVNIRSISIRTRTVCVDGSLFGSSGRCLLVTMHSESDVTAT